VEPSLDGSQVVHDLGPDVEDQGPQFTEHLEDGFDIDEAGDGSVILAMSRTSISGNFDEGLDLDEEGDGDIDVTLEDVQANGNADDNIKFSEDADQEDVPVLGADSGGIMVDFDRVRASGALDGDGINLEEFGEGRIQTVSST
jgi:hypothetical protein